MKIDSLFTSSFITMMLVVITSLFSPTASANLMTHSSEMRLKLSALEKASHGRLGIYLINASDSDYFSYQGSDRFPLCSTSKIMVTAKLLKDSQSSLNLLDSTVKINKVDLVNYNPITGKNIGKTMSIAELSKAALQYSDNTAMNLLLQKAGGIKAINAFARSLGDHDFLLSRNEPTLNTTLPGDTRDTTTPRAMAKTLHKLTLGDALESDKKALLISWLEGNTTGEHSIKAGVPTDWRVGDKTGSGDYGTTNDVAVIWTDKNKPLVLAIYFTQYAKTAMPRKDVLAKAAKIVTSYLD
ncbi:class A beta-lactamase [Tatumella ptyseos]|uniref:class A beta-lactamase n=1 Tax=Tatumella ptyseos TaxID=82987 RepID=UPI003F881639